MPMYHLINKWKADWFHTKKNVDNFLTETKCYMNQKGVMKTEHASSDLFIIFCVLLLCLNQNLDVLANWNRP